MKSDKELQDDVLDELRWEPAVNAAHIGVSARQGVITLTGHVPSFAEKYAAEQAAECVYGVKAVANELDVKLPGSSKRGDEDIAAACVRALEANYAVPDGRIKAVVRDGTVVLDGEVDWEYQRRAADSAVRYLTGVVGVANNIKITPHVSPRDVKDKIEAALKRSAEIDARRISIKIEDGKVILHGNVRSRAERMEAQRAAWGAPGVTDVENAITVVP
jgi:osmotically-inducible protein OsmY